MNLAAENGYIDILEWWRNSGLELKYSKHKINVCFDYVRKKHRTKLRTNWKNSGLL